MAWIFRRRTVRIHRLP